MQKICGFTFDALVIDQNITNRLHSLNGFGSRIQNSKNMLQINFVAYYKTNYSGTWLRATLLNRWAAKVLQVGRETFCRNLKIFLEKIMNYES